jgi:hypothetical protein
MWPGSGDASSLFSRIDEPALMIIIFSSFVNKLLNLPAILVLATKKRDNFVPRAGPPHSVKGKIRNTEHGHATRIYF